MKQLSLALLAMLLFSGVHGLWAVERPTAVPTAANVPTTRDGKTDAAGFVPYWIGLEPITISAEEAGGKGVDKDYMRGEVEAMPVPGETVTVAGEKRTWKTVSSSVHTPIVDCDDIDGATYNAVIYLVAYVKLDKEEPKATIAWSTDDGGSLFVNGKEVARSPKPRSCPIDGTVTKDIPLKKGVNVLMLKVLNGYGNCNGLLRLVDSNDRVMAGVPLLMAPEGKEAPKDAKWYVIDTGSKPVDEPFTAYLEKSKAPK